MYEINKDFQNIEIGVCNISTEQLSDLINGSNKND